MSVIKNLRSLSDMEFYKEATRIRKELSLFLLKDFNTRRNLRSVNQVVKTITEEEQNTINAIFEKYGKTSNHAYKSEYPEWFISFERIKLCEILSALVTNITQANSVYPHYSYKSVQSTQKILNEVKK